MIYRITFLMILLLTSCSDEFNPKPNAYLSLEYPENTYKKLESELPFSFEHSSLSVAKSTKNKGLNISYPRMKARINITYKPIKNNLRGLLLDTEKMTYRHTIKADEIKAPKEFLNFAKKVFGSIYEITGNSASAIQFHLTDSTNHFLVGALYFEVKPNYDSIRPAISYIRKDIIKLMETFSWE
ncbi:MAG: gliding motility lipoprotein GldD [Flavobacteriaceae bacterium]|nr:gliding motility lipoprotein GldD [Flavobacteriaceae bacterium]